MLPLSDNCFCGFSDDFTRQDHASGSQMVLRLCKLSRYIIRISLVLCRWTPLGRVKGLPQL